MLILIRLSFFGQNTTIDSLKTALISSKHDTTKCIILSQLAETASDGEWEKYNENLKDLAEANLAKNPLQAEKNIYLRELALAYNNKGLILIEEGKNEEAVIFYNKSLKIREDINDRRGISMSLSNIGMVYQKKGDILNALKYHQRCLKIQEELNFKQGIASSLNNIAGILNSQEDYSESLKFLKRSLEISKQIKDQASIANISNNIGLNYINQGNLAEGLMYCEQSLKISEAVNDKITIGNALHNIGSVYSRKGDLNYALKYYQKSLKIREETHNKLGITRSLECVSSIYFAQKNYNNAIIFANKSLQFSQELGFPENIRNAALLLTKIYRSKNKPKEGYKYYELYIQMRDSITNQENRKASIKSQLKYEYEKKAAADSVKVAEEKKITTIQLKHEENQRYFLYGGLLLTIAFGGFMFNRFRITKKQKNIIEQQKIIVENQKHLVEEKQKEIMDSIHYAKLIQQILLPTDKYMERVLKK